MDNSTIQQLLKFISGYESPERPQRIEEIQGDFQLAGLNTLLHSYLSSSPNAKILDIGCGNGVLMGKLVEINAFETYPKFEYIGFDFPDKLNDAFATANKFMILSHVKLLQCEIEWTEYMEAPCIVVIRNVFHELMIDDAAKLIHEICMFLPENSVLLLQDMTTLPVAEKMRVGWLGIHLSNIFKKGGIRVNHTPDTSKRGIDVFLIEGQRQKKCELKEKDIRMLLISARREQLNILYEKYAEIEEKPNNVLPLSRLNHDIAAISFVLTKSGETDFGGEIKDGQTVASIFNLAFRNLSENDLFELQKSFKYPEIKGFQNRGYHIDALDNFFRSDKTIFILKAGPHMGKKTAVWWILFQKLKHDRLPLYVNLKEGDDIFSILENVVFQLGIGKFIDVEVFASLQDLPTEELRTVIHKSIAPLATKTILILDGFENSIDPEGNIENEDVEWLIDFWSSLNNAKIIIESRWEVKQLPFERCQFEYMTTFPSAGKNKHQYTIQLLHELVPINYRTKDMEYGGYPLELLETLNNHPYFTYIAGTIIRNNPDSTCLKNQNFISHLKTRLYENLISNFSLKDNELELLHSLTLVKNAFPLKFVGMVIGDFEIAKKLLEKGLILESSHERFLPLGVVRNFYKTDTEKDVSKLDELKWHEIFADVFYRLYQNESDPSFFRQSYYHATLAGNKSDFSAYRVPEIAICADFWYKSKRYSDSLWAHKKIQEKRSLHSKEQMKMASCLIRTNEFKEGKKSYLDLIWRYKTWLGVKSSYIDSLLFTGSHAESAKNMLFKIPEIERGFYWHRQAARCYRQLSKRKDAYKEYEEAILDSPSHTVWQVIQELINYAHEAGDGDTECKWLEHGWKYLKIRSDDIKINLGAYFERTDELEKAEKLLFEAHQNNPSNAYCILPLVKTLCRDNKISEAEIILKNAPPNTTPHNILLYAKIIYLKVLGDFSECEQLLLSLHMDEMNRTSIHRWGQWADLFLSWSFTLKGREQRDIAFRGLKFVKQIINEKNVPAMMACLELSKITNNFELQEKLQETIHEVNDAYF